MAKSEVQHFDKLGTELFPGDYVVVPTGHNQTIIAEVIKLNNKMLTIRKIGSKLTKNSYSTETVKLDTNLVTMYILRNQK